MGIATVTKVMSSQKTRLVFEIVNSGVSSDTYVPKYAFLSMFRLVISMTFVPFSNLVSLLQFTFRVNPVTVRPSCVSKCVHSWKREMVLVSFTEETDEDDLIGGFRLKHNGDGDSQTVWEDGPAIVAMKKGAVLVLDEVDLGMLKDHVSSANPCW
jgi:hypothetical protein